MIWGLVLGFHAACTTFAGLSVARTLLGVFESWLITPGLRFPCTLCLLRQCCPYPSADHRHVV